MDYALSMKTLTTFVTVLALSAGLAIAQDLGANANQSVAGSKAGVDVTGFKAPATLGPNQSTKQFPNMHPDLRPQLGGVFVDGAKYGTQLINPAAPASYGMGEKYLAAPSSTQDLQHESGRAAHHDAGGIKVFTFEF
jgi:hypothetical protein